MNTRVCHITSAHSRYDIRILVKQCKSLSNNGYDVTLIVNDDKEDETIDGVHIVSTKYKPRNRMDRFINSKNKIYTKAIEVDADIYQLHDPDLLPTGNKLKRLGKKVIFDSHEDVPKQIKDKQWIPSIIRNIISKTYEIYEKTAVKKYDAIISVTPHIVERFKEINSNTILITNYPIINNKSSSNTDFQKKRAICFAGGIIPQWNHEHIIKAIESIDNIEYILAGSGTKEYIGKLEKLEGWKKVRYLGRIPHEDVIEIYNESMIGMTLLSNSTQVGNEGTLGNTKIFEFMGTGLPVICSNNKLWNEIIQENNCGISIDPENISEIKNAIDKIITNPKLGFELGSNGKKAVKNEFNWETQEKKLIVLYKSIQTSNRRDN